jgi:hypothetical protein
VRGFLCLLNVVSSILILMGMPTLENSMCNSGVIMQIKHWNNLELQRNKARMKCISNPEIMSFSDVFRIVEKHCVDYS